MSAAGVEEESGLGGGGGGAGGEEGGGRKNRGRRYALRKIKQAERRTAENMRTCVSQVTPSPVMCLLPQMTVPRVVGLLLNWLSSLIKWRGPVVGAAWQTAGLVHI